MEQLSSPLESARFIAGRSRDVSVDEEGARKVAESLFDRASEEAFSLSGWKALHELNPRAASEEAVNWVFLVDTLNFSFWSDSAEQKCLVRYKGKEYSGYWALCAAVNRALDDGIPITSASYYATMTLDQVRQVFRSDTEVPMPLLEERHQVLNESGTVLLEKFGGSFLTCVKKSENSAQKLLRLVVENFPSYRDEAVFEKKKVAFYKRAQILVADTWSVLEGKGDGFFGDISSLTIFADYRIPQVLVHLKALKYSEDLMKKLREGTVFKTGDREEVEIRGCSIWCCNLICKHLLEFYEKKGQDMRDQINAVLLDYYLWDYARDHREDMKDIPFHQLQKIWNEMSTGTITFPANTWSTEMEVGMEEIPVKVAVRIRPLLSKEVLHNHQVCVRLVPNTQQIIIGKDRAFTFDFVFGKNSTQGEVYSVCIKPLLMSLTEGYNATVFAYGQTGSGKTYTIGCGHIASIAEDEKGIIPRAIQELFQHISENHNIDFHVKVSYIEVYKEELRDLLELETSVKDLHIREDEKGNTVIVGAKEFEVECADEVMSLLESGNAARHTGTTQMNEHSSRSHAIFTISICQKQSAESRKNTDVPQDPSWKSVRMIASKFHFVDLAGSERVTKTGNTGERFKESIQINSGLLALGNVISALGDPKRKSVHIPYRDAKITRILKDSLGGNAKTVMITCISPSSSDFDESLNSLKYANRAKNIRNKPVVNYNPDQDRIDEMELEIRLLREALQNQQVSNQCSHDVNQERIRISSLEEQLTQLQVQCFSYRNCIDEAFPFLVDLNDDTSLNKSQRDRLQSWITMVQEVRKEALTMQQGDTRTGTSHEPHHITVLQLKRELKKCQQALVMDEEVFSQKDHELMMLQKQIKALIQENEEHLESLKKAEETQRLQNEKIVEQQVLIDQLKEKLEKFTVVKTLDISSACEDEPGVVASARRPYSVPLTKSLLYSLHPPSGTEARKVYTSPPAFSLARMMAGFRARSQMILSCIEDQDEVLHCQLSDESDGEEENTHSKKKSSFKRSITRTWTRKQASLCFPFELIDIKCQVENSSLLNKPALQNETPTGEEIDSLQKSHVFNMQKLKNSELRLTEAQQKMRELALNIKMKEELIKELVRTGKDAQSVSRQYTLKISKLDKESEQAKTELAETQKQLQELESKELRDIPEKARLQKEFRKKMDAAKLKVQALQKKKQDSKKLASLSNQSEKRATELEQNIVQMKHQQTLLEKRLHEESEKKKQLETEIQRDQQQIKELQLKMEQQQKILTLKDKEIAAFKKRNNSAGTSQKSEKLEEQKKWLDEEMERVLQQHRQLAELEEDLKKRESIVAKKEALLQEKSHLEIRKLRSSQALNKDSMKLSSRLSMLDQELCDRSLQLQGSTTEDRTDILEKIRVLQKERDQLLTRRNSVDEKLKEGKVLSAEEEHTLFQLEEGIEALEAAIDYKNESIQSRQHLLRSSSQILSHSEDNIVGKLVSLSAAELRAILFRYFNKIVGLRETERKLQLQTEEQEMKVTEQENVIRELESALEHIKLQCDRQLTLQHKEHEKKLQLILHHFTEQDGECVAETLKEYEVKVQQLEKELFFYKKTSRELKKKLKSFLGESSHLQLAPSKCNSAGDKASSHDEAEVSSEEFKLKTYSQAGKIKEVERTNILRARQNSYKLGEDVSEFGCSKECLSNIADDRLGEDETQPSKSQSHLPSVIQRRETITQFQGVTSVKLSRRELRHIPPSELSLRRSSLGAGVSFIAPDSIEMDKK